MHEAIDGVFGRRLDVNEAVVGTDFKVFAAVLVYKRAAQDTETPGPGGQRNWSCYLSARAPNRLDDLGRRGVEATVIKAS